MPRRPTGAVNIQLYSSFNLSARWGWVVNATPRPLYPRERPGTHCIGGWVGPRADLDGYGKSRPPPGIDPRNVQPVASRYTDCAMPDRGLCLQPHISSLSHRPLCEGISVLNPLNPELNSICYLLALLAHHFLHVSRIMVKSLPLRLIMSYIYIYIYMTLVA